MFVSMGSIPENLKVSISFPLYPTIADSAGGDHVARVLPD
jgi:hypothetical protein